MPPLNLMSPLLWQSTPFGDPDAWLDFVHVHEQWHRELAKATGTRFLALDDLRDNLRVNTELHEELARALELPRANELASADLRNESAYMNWMALHAHDHERLRRAAAL